MPIGGRPPTRVVFWRCTRCRSSLTRFSTRLLPYINDRTSHGIVGRQGSSAATIARLTTRGVREVAKSAAFGNDRRGILPSTASRRRICGRAFCAADIRNLSPSLIVISRSGIPVTVRLTSSATSARYARLGPDLRFKVSCAHLRPGPANCSISPRLRATLESR
jgi:hypothetical protein